MYGFMCMCLYYHLVFDRLVVIQSKMFSQTLLGAEVVDSPASLENTISGLTSWELAM